MSLYEGMFLLDIRQANRDWDGSLDNLKLLLTKHGGEILRCEKWGERRLAYEIKGRRRATYVLTYFQAEGEAVNRIYRECELSDLILRALMLNIRSLPPEEPSRERADVSSEAKLKEKAAARPAEVAAAKPAEEEKKAAPARQAGAETETLAEEAPPTEEVALTEATPEADVPTEGVTPKTEN